MKIYGSVNIKVFPDPSSDIESQKHGLKGGTEIGTQSCNLVTSSTTIPTAKVPYGHNINGDISTNIQLAVGEQVPPELNPFTAFISYLNGIVILDLPKPGDLISKPQIIRTEGKGRKSIEKIAKVIGSDIRLYVAGRVSQSVVVAVAEAVGKPSLESELSTALGLIEAAGLIVDSLSQQVNSSQFNRAKNTRDQTVISTLNSVQVLSHQLRERISDRDFIALTNRLFQAISIQIKLVNIDLLVERLKIELGEQNSEKLFSRTLSRVVQAMSGVHGYSGCKFCPIGCPQHPALERPEDKIEATLQLLSE